MSDSQVGGKSFDGSYLWVLREVRICFATCRGYEGGFPWKTEMSPLLSNDVRNSRDLEYRDAVPEILFALVHSQIHEYWLQMWLIEGPLLDVTLNANVDYSPKLGDFPKRFRDILAQASRTAGLMSGWWLHRSGLARYSMTKVWLHLSCMATTCQSPQFCYPYLVRQISLVNRGSWQSSDASKPLWGA